MFRNIILLFIILMISFCSDYKSEIRYDGLYHSRKLGHSNYLRFYNDGTVISIIFASDPQSAARSTAIDDENIPKGKYSFQNDSIFFYVNFGSGYINYYGKLDGECLELESYNPKDESRFENEYCFVPVDFSVEKLFGIINENTHKGEINNISSLYKGKYNVTEARLYKTDFNKSRIVIGVEYDFDNFQKDNKYQIQVFLKIDSKNFLIKELDIKKEKDKIKIDEDLSEILNSKLVFANSIKIKVSLYKSFGLGFSNNSQIELCNYISKKILL